ncbi:TetR/AcrR family transcriptional regulator [Kitasatospora kifunensis]|uniref:AcrR family transcriptional regulator n=1 Tax=Kitasatospora kifunensis TaxID=58351 RepID=A0A7W7R8H1_KITKI|nr:TetR/AcrR family transcriptional regulator [Kitasatospora kifunensis]MBB4927229.1 AcrR family transcriptional regulator [Kitasatospora kifunensis]
MEEPPEATRNPDDSTAPPAGPPALTPALTPVRRPGGRSARVREQVLEAVGAQLVEHGYDGLTVDAVAARAGVHRTTVYRRWTDVGGLLADLLDAAKDEAWEPQDTGRLESDLTALNEEIHQALSADSSITVALIAASFRSTEAAGALQRFWEDRYGRSEVVVERAVRRGELPPHTDARRLLLGATAPLYHQFVVLRAPADPRLPGQAARAAATAAAAGAFTRDR